MLKSIKLLIFLIYAVLFISCATNQNETSRQLAAEEGTAPITCENDGKEAIAAWQDILDCTRNRNSANCNALLGAIEGQTWAEIAREYSLIKDQFDTRKEKALALWALIPSTVTGGLQSALKTYAEKKAEPLFKALREFTGKGGTAAHNYWRGGVKNNFDAFLQDPSSTEGRREVIKRLNQGVQSFDEALKNSNSIYMQNHNSGLEVKAAAKEIEGMKVNYEKWIRALESGVQISPEDLKKIPLTAFQAHNIDEGGSLRIVLDNIYFPDNEKLHPVSQKANREFSENMVKFFTDKDNLSMKIGPNKTPIHEVIAKGSSGPAADIKALEEVLIENEHNRYSAQEVSEYKGKMIKEDPKKYFKRAGIPYTGQNIDDLDEATSEKLAKKISLKELRKHYKGEPDTLEKFKTMKEIKADLNKGGEEFWQVGFTRGMTKEWLSASFNMPFSPSNVEAYGLAMNRMARGGKMGAGLKLLGRMQHKLLRNKAYRGIIGSSVIVGLISTGVGLTANYWGVFRDDPARAINMIPFRTVKLKAKDYMTNKSCQVTFKAFAPRFSLDKPYFSWKGDYVESGYIDPDVCEPESLKDTDNICEVLENRITFNPDEPNRPDNNTEMTIGNVLFLNNAFSQLKPGEILGDECQRNCETVTLFTTLFIAKLMSVRNQTPTLSRLSTKGNTHNAILSSGETHTVILDGVKVKEIYQPKGCDSVVCGYRFNKDGNPVEVLRSESSGYKWVSLDRPIFSEQGPLECSNEVSPRICRAYHLGDSEVGFFDNYFDNYFKSLLISEQVRDRVNGTIQDRAEEMPSFDI